MDRREFALAGIATAAAAACAPTLVQAAAPLPVFAVLFDQRFEAAQVFARAATRQGRKVLGYDGDLTAVWLRELEPRWSRRAGALVGMTTPRALFCLEQLAAQHWLRVLTRNEQRARLGQALISWVIA